MTRLLFICQGNTCRSPLAEAIAKRVFGPNHSVSSVGLETTDGRRAANHAVIVGRELHLDLSRHRTRSIESVELTDFDLLIPLDEDVTAALHVPAGVRLEQFAIPDPYGKPVEEYRKTATAVRRNVRRLYAIDTLHRLTSPKPPQGSHALGIVVRAAKEFEKETVPVVKAWSPNLKDKLPLGNLASALRRAASKSSVPAAKVAVDLSTVMAKVNKAWVKLKHQDDPPLPELVAATKQLLSGFDLLENAVPPN